MVELKTILGYFCMKHLLAILQLSLLLKFGLSVAAVNTIKLNEIHVK